MGAPVPALPGFPACNSQFGVVGILILKWKIKGLSSELSETPELNTPPHPESPACLPPSLLSCFGEERGESLLRSAPAPSEEPY